MSNKFFQHLQIVTGHFPEMEGMTGFIFYSFLVYLVVLFFGWLVNPTVDKIIQDDIKSQRQKGKGERAREENRKIELAQANKTKSH